MIYHLIWKTFETNFLYPLQVKVNLKIFPKVKTFILNKIQLKFILINKLMIKISLVFNLKHKKWKNSFKINNLVLNY